MQQSFNELLDYYLADELSAEQLEEFFRLLEIPGNQEIMNARIGEQWREQPIAIPPDAPLAERSIGKLRMAIKGPVKIRHMQQQRSWRRWAVAAAVLLLASSAYLWLPRKSTLQMDVEPGKNGAILTLGDGSEVVLDSLGNGIIAQQHGATVSLRNGQLTYSAGGNMPGKASYNTMTTPKGRQFRIVLPDSTLVWLNAASSIRYPTNFSGNERKVEITGEVYFEVTRNARMPFKVTTPQKTEIEVLGTHFNINAYEKFKATLLEGSVRINPFDILLKPGQQAQLDGEIKVTDVDTDQAIAWKNGAFDFNNVGLQEAMRQLERWYDIEVVYENGVPDIPFSGRISRNTSLSGILKLLAGTNLTFRMEGRKLVITK